MLSQFLVRWMGHLWKLPSCSVRQNELCQHQQSWVRLAVSQDRSMAFDSLRCQQCIYLKKKQNKKQKNKLYKKYQCLLHYSGHLPVSQYLYMAAFSARRKTWDWGEVDILLQQSEPYMAKRNISVFYSSYCGQMLDRERYRNHGIHARGNGSMQHRSATFQTSVRGLPW